MPARITGNENLTQRELVEVLARRSPLSKKQVAEFLHHFLGLVMETLQEGHQVKLSSFGTFATRVRASRNGRHPKTGNPVFIQSVRVPIFKPGKRLCNSVK